MRASRVAGHKNRAARKKFSNFFAARFSCVIDIDFVHRASRFTLVMRTNFLRTRASAQRGSLRAHRARSASFCFVTHVNVNVADVRNVAVYGVMKRIAFQFVVRDNREHECSASLSH